MTKAKAIHWIKNREYYCAQTGAIFRKENASKDLGKVTCDNCLRKAKHNGIEIVTVAKTNPVKVKCGVDISPKVGGEYHICTLEKGHERKKHKCPCGYEWVEK